MPLRPRSSPVPALNENSDGGSSLSLDFGPSSTLCALCGKPLAKGPRHGKARFHSDCQEEGRRQADSKYTEFVRKAQQKDLGERFRAYQSAVRWVTRHQDMNRRFFCNSASRFLFTAFLEFFPQDGRDAPAVFNALVQRAWNLLLIDEDQEARNIALELKKLLETGEFTRNRPGERWAEQIALDCEELLIDCGFGTDGNLAGSVRQLEARSLQVIRRWKAAEEPSRFAAALLRHANLLRAYPDFFERGDRGPLEAIEVAERLLNGSGLRDPRVAILKREAAHRRLQLSTRAGSLKAARESFSELQELV